MKRLTTNKPVSEMEMNELAHNSCYIGEDYAARYRDFEKDLEARDLARKLMLDHGIWGENDSEMTDDEDFDNGIMAGLMLNPCDDLEGLTALFYRNLWAMADLYERLKKYEDLEEQGLLLKLHKREVFESIGDTVYYIFDYEIIECTNCGISLDCEGNLWATLACDERIFPYREPMAEVDTDPTDWCQNWTYIGLDRWEESVFLTKEEAEAALAEMEKKQCMSF